MWWTVVECLQDREMFSEPDENRPGFDLVKMSRHDPCVPSVSRPPLCEDIEEVSHRGELIGALPKDLFVLNIDNIK